MLTASPKLSAVRLAVSATPFPASAPPTAPATTPKIPPRAPSAPPRAAPATLAPIPAPPDESSDDCSCSDLAFSSVCSTGGHFD